MVNASVVTDCQQVAMKCCMDAINAASGIVVADEGFSVGYGSLDDRSRDAQGWRWYWRCDLQLQPEIFQGRPSESSLGSGAQRC